jgi:N-acetylglutamate synthase-like GNAT family acetyltransferase
VGKADASIRQAEERDTQALAELLAAWGHPLSCDEVRAKIRAFAEAPDHQFLVAETDGAVVGFAAMNTALSSGRPGKIGIISGMAVAPSQQRRGIGERLVQSAEAWVRSRGASSVRVTSASHRTETAHPFYAALGYRQTGIRFDKEL